MQTALAEAVAALIARETGTGAAVRHAQGAGGGCINHAEVITLDDGRRYFLKSNPDPLPHLFEREAEGLAALAAPGAIRVPKPLGTGGGGGVPPFIVMEYIESGRPGKDFFETFGRQFAALHRNAQHDRFGFPHDNYIGSTPQVNTWSTSWPAFWRDHRLGYHLELARRRGLSDRAMDRAGEKLLDRLDDLLDVPGEPACLLHGDLWSGNYLADSSGAPVLIDPATYYGHREADLAMTLVFGGFSPAFYAAYQEAWPLPPGSDDRLAVYKLYHLLNHLNLFGRSYYGSCMAILDRFAGP